MNKKRSTQEVLLEQYQKYPEMQLQDFMKFLFQSAFGCEHLVSDMDTAANRIQKEAEGYEESQGELTEALDGAFCRVSLGWLQKGLRAETLAALFVLSAETVPDGTEKLEEKLGVFLSMCEEGLFPFSKEEVLLHTQSWKAAGYPPCHHSERFRTLYKPSYRLLKKELVPFLPLFAMVDRELEAVRKGEKEQVLLAVEGGSASGKTTLGGLLQKIYPVTIFHMDDFFLRPEQRTKERLAEAGGNVDRERFLEEVLQPLKQGAEVVYRPFDCGTQSLMEPVKVHPQAFCVIEGAYSMHPLLADYYDRSVFLRVSEETQKDRIRKRNAPFLAERFFKEWIPMEERYFRAFSVPERCDRILFGENEESC